MLQENKIPFLRNFSPLMNLMTVFSLVFFGTLIADLMLWVFAKTFWGINLFNEKTSFSTELSPSVNSLVQVNYILHIVFAFITPATIFRRFIEFPHQDYLFIRRKINLKTGFVIALILFLSIPAANFLTYVNNAIDFSFISPEFANELRQAKASGDEYKFQLLSQPDVSLFLINLFTIALLTAIGEELIFRSVFQRIFMKIFRNVHVAVLVAATLFSLFHLDYYGFFPRLFMGIVLGYIYLSTANIWYCILFHFLNNAFGVTFGWLIGKGYNVSFIDNIGGGANDKWLGFAILVMLAAFVVIMINRLINKDLVQEMREN